MAAGASKYLTCDQIIAVADGVTIAPQQSAATLQRNIYEKMAGPSSPGKIIPPHLIRSMCHGFRMSRAQLTVQQLQGITINESFGTLQALSEAKWFATLVARHNDSNGDYHLNMFETVLIGRDLPAERDIVHLNMT
jgi:hypothetical protein